MRELRIVKVGASLLFVADAKDLRRGVSPFNVSTNHKDAVRVESCGRACRACFFQGRPRLELHRLEIEHLCEVSDCHVII